MTTTLYTWKTPNGRKPAIMLEELGAAYEVVGIDISKGEQFSERFLAVGPNNKIPALVDDLPGGGTVSMFESGAILTYLAEKSGRFLAPSGPDRYTALEWLFWQVGGVGPMFGQLGFFARSEEKSALAIDRFTKEAERLIGVLEGRVSSAPFLAGAQYTIADIATYPWMAAAVQMMGPLLGDVRGRFPATAAWLDRVGERPAVKRGMDVLQG